MPIPILLAGVAAVTAISGIAKGGKAISNNKKAKEYIADAERIYNEANEQLESWRTSTSATLEVLGETKLNVWSEGIGTFLEYFKKFKKVDVRGNVELNQKLKMNIENVGTLKNMKVASLKATEIIGAGVSSLGAGALAGVASYGGAMMFATASTGTAISALSGAAATNATLAWFGGGSLAAGGLGMAGGTVVLGGIVAGPVLAVAGSIMKAKSEENLAKAQKTYSDAELAVEKMNTMTDFLKKLSDIVINYDSFINEFVQYYYPILEKVKEIYYDAKIKQERNLLKRILKEIGIRTKINFKKLTLEQQKTLQLSWLMTQILHKILISPILTQKGDIDENSNMVLNEAKESTYALLGTAN